MVLVAALGVGVVVAMLGVDVAGVVVTVGVGVATLVNVGEDGTVVGGIGVAVSAGGVGGDITTLVSRWTVMSSTASETGDEADA